MKNLPFMGIGSQYYKLSRSEAATVATAPSNSVIPVISGNLVVGQTLSTTQGSWSGSFPINLSYQWARNTVNIPGANNSTYVLQTADVGTTISAKVTASNSVGNVTAVSISTVAINPLIIIPSNITLPVISGNTVEGQILTSSTGIWNGTAPITYSYQWKRNGTNIAGATSSTYVLQNSDVGFRVNVAVTASNTAGSSTTNDDNQTLISQLVIAPSNTSLPIVTGVLTEGQTLTVSNGSWNGTAPITYSYQWKRNDVDISGATSSTYVLQNSDVGTTISATVTASNTAGNANVTSSATAIIQPIIIAPSNTSLPVISGNTVEGQILTSSTGTWNGSTATYSYQWKRNGTNIAGATSSTYTLQNSDVGTTISSLITATNASGFASIISLSTVSITPILTLPSYVGVPVIIGTPTHYQTLTVSNGSWNGTAPITYSYQWKRNGANIVGATSSTYVLQNSDVGTTISATVTASNSIGSANATSAITSNINGVTPVNTAIPTISGTAQQDQIITCDPGMFSGTSPIVISFQWLKSGVIILGAISSSYAIQSSDVGSTLTCQINASNSYGNITISTTPTAIVISNATPPDYIVTTDAEWTALMVNNVATLSGKTVEIRGALGDTALASKTFTTQFTIRGGVGGSVRRFNLTGTVSNVQWKDLTFQMTGWPKAFDSTFYLNGGTYSGFVFDGCTFRHGYGAGLVNFNTASESFPENVRVNNILTANTVSARFPLTFQDATATGAWIEFFNRGAAVVHYRVGNSSVVAKVATIYSAATAYVPGDVVYNAGGANTYECLVASTGNATNNSTYWSLVGRRVTATLNSERSASFNPQTTTHIAIISESGSQQINARTEIGMSEYLANAFAASGSANLSDVIIRNCEVQDMASAFKGLPGASTLAVLIDSRTRRVFMDQADMLVKPGGTLYVVRNSFGLPFSRSGIAEALNGDARDPHGDTIQHFGTGVGTIGPLYYAGNRPYMQPVRAGCVSQGIFASDNNYSPSYDRLFAINNAFLGGAPNGLNSGESGYPVGSAMLYGNTIVDARDITAQTRMRFENVFANQHVYIGKSISVGQVGVATYDQSIDLTGVTDASTVFTDLTAAQSATTRLSLDAALTTIGIASNIGVSATSNVIDWNTPNYANVIMWPLLPSGVEWPNILSQPIDAMITLPLRRVLNRRASQAVSPGAGVEWRSVAADGVTEVQAWTTAVGTVTPDQFIQIRKQSSAVALTPVDFAITINGFTQTTIATTAAAAPTVFHTQSGTGPYFRDPSNNVPANTTRMEFRANIYPTTIPTTSVKLFTQESLSCDLELMSSSTFRLSTKNGANAAILSSAPGTGGFVINQWQEFVLDVNQATGTATLTNNGINVGSWSWAPTASPFFQTGREISLLGTTGGLNLVPAGWRVEFAECYFTTGGVRSLRKRVSGNAAAVNDVADAWKLGGAAT